MITLTEHQVDYINSLLATEGITFKPLQEELLDHICCLTEQQMATGLPFHQAVSSSFDHFKTNELQHIQKASIHSLTYKKRIMKITSFFALGLMLTFTTIWVQFSEPPTISPLKGDYEISSGFGQRMHPFLKQLKMHKGVDYKAPIGTPVVATSDGIVDKVVDKNTGYGKHIVIKHDDTFSTLYAQLSKMDVQVGDKVKKGQVIGAVGSSGTSTAPHLHYEVRKDGEHVNPENYLNP